MSGYQIIESDTGLIKAWTTGVPVEDVARQQLQNVASLPFIHRHVAAMPDLHWGMGATVGSVIATKGAIVPAAVGVDLGCGMMAVQTTLDARRLPDDLGPVRAAIEGAVPHDVPEAAGRLWAERFAARYQAIVEKHPKAGSPNTARHLGTLGTGNHFIELCLDEADRLWVMLHSGSRGLGNRFGSYFIDRAKREMERWFIRLPDRDLAYLAGGSELFDDYVAAVDFAQAFAFDNRRVMMAAILATLRQRLPAFEATDVAVNCHHNYVAREHHFGANVWVTRKGAVRARVGSSCAARASPRRSIPARTGPAGRCRGPRPSGASRWRTTRGRPPASSAARTPR
jgi:tRNA-splicing ligase RtcB